MITTSHKPGLLVALTGEGVPHPTAISAPTSHTTGKSSAT
jgi:hypothetical protein